jgi:hypothetical protein
VSTSGLPVALLAQIDKLANDERRTRGNVIRLLLDGIFATREEAQTAIDRSQYFRVRVNSLQAACIYVLEEEAETDRLSPKLSPNGLTDSHSA